MLMYTSTHARQVTLSKAEGDTLSQATLKAEGSKLQVSNAVSHPFPLLRPMLMPTSTHARQVTLSNAEGDTLSQATLKAEGSNLQVSNGDADGREATVSVVTGMLSPHPHAST
jgi:hypothetical protein